MLHPVFSLLADEGGFPKVDDVVAVDGAVVGVDGAVDGVVDGDVMEMVVFPDCIRVFNDFFSRYFCFVLSFIDAVLLS